MQHSLFERILNWANDTFPRSQHKDHEPYGIINHLLQEFKELEESGWKDVEEMADMGFMLIQLAEARGGNLEEAMEAKLYKNMQRVWPSEPDENGVYNHVSESPV